MKYEKGDLLIVGAGFGLCLCKGTTGPYVNLHSLHLRKDVELYRSHLNALKPEKVG